MPGRSLPVVLPRRHAGLKLLQRARDEAHRFGLMHHRKARTRRTLTSPLLEIPGLGPATARRLLAVFGNDEAVLAATPQALAAAAGKASASRIERWRASREDKGR